MATSLRPPSSALRSTPVRIGRESSELAAGVTCVSAAPKAPASSVTASPSGSARRGNSSAGISRISNSAEPPVTRACSSSVSKRTRPSSTERTTSEARRAGSTTTPSSSPFTPTVTEMVRSRSLPVTCRSPPASWRRTPDRTGSAPPRLATARPAVPRASAKTSRSQRNFMSASPGPSRGSPRSYGGRANGTSSISPAFGHGERSCSRETTKCCGLGTTTRLRWSGAYFLSPLCSPAFLGPAGADAGAWGEPLPCPQARPGRERALSTVHPVARPQLRPAGGGCRSGR